MNVKALLVGVCAAVLLACVAVPAVAEAAEPPTITSIAPDSCGSAGGCKVIIKGTHFEEVSNIRFGSAAAKIITTGTLTKGECKPKSSTEIECIVPFHECGTVFVTVTSPAGTSAESTGAEFTYLCEIYKNEVAIGSAHNPLIGYGQIDLTSPQINSTFECVNVGFGSAWNENQSGRGEILVWWTSGHAPTAEHTELGSRCRFIYHGTEENQPGSPLAWASAEPPLKLVSQEGIVCAEKTKNELAECPNESERVHETLTREVTRENLGLPWQVEVTERGGAPHVIIGVATTRCKEQGGVIPTECEPSERVLGSPEACDIPPTPDPSGCIKVQIVSDPPLNVHLEYEGYLEPRAFNNGPNGLSPSSWEFEGHEKGEPTLQLRESPSTEASITGSLKILGYSNQELITLR